MKKLILLLLFLPISVSAQRDWSLMQVATTEVAPGIYRLFVEPGVATVLFFGPDGALLIDAAYQQTTPQLKAAIEQLTNLPVEYLINTHHHADHTGGNAMFGAKATIIAHRFVKDFVSNVQVQGTRQIAALPREAWPDITFTDRLHLDFNEQILEIIHLPGGHTSGDAIIYFPASKVLVLGDLLFADNFPFVDVANGGNPLRFLEHLKWISANYPDDVIIIGGHGPIYNMEQFRSYIANLEKSMNAVSNAKKLGLTLEQAKSIRILKEWESWGRFFITEDRWIETLYQTL
ncbi:MAG TPA: MBL fold metallo-hydrolase [Bacteroidales bacterium]|nr:MBL fold metallo-hydrolase [Bacteroidales bacterium]